jgi:mono/diheme cytochrome c family protein
MRKILSFACLLMLASCDRRGAAPQPAPAPAPRPEAIARGATLFAHLCTPCHGERGDGRGVRRARLATAPADLTRLSEKRRDPQRLFEVLSDGVAGTDMPSWRALPEGDRRDLVAFVRSLSGSRAEITPAGAPAPIN